jgi:hypothetical protein
LAHLVQLEHLYVGVGAVERAAVVVRRHQLEEHVHVRLRRDHG